jgi:hypothetical protein
MGSFECEEDSLPLPLVHTHDDAHSTTHIYTHTYTHIHTYIASPHARRRHQQDPPTPHSVPAGLVSPAFHRVCWGSVCVSVCDVDMVLEYVSVCDEVLYVEREA